jgi:uncharacterized membrane protein YphA (DoxX/SURF4 family)
MKKNKIIYWSSTGLVSLGFLMSSFMYLGKNPELVGNFAKIGFPVLFITILGVAKLLGSLALINPWFPTLKEWAYAGFTFTLIGAVWVHIETRTSFVAPLIFLLLLGVSYWSHNKLKAGVKEINYIAS